MGGRFPLYIIVLFFADGRRGAQHPGARRTALHGDPKARFEQAGEGLGFVGLESAGHLDAPGRDVASAPEAAHANMAAYENYLGKNFPKEATAAIRGLPGIDADFEVFADRFLDPGEPDDPTVYEGYGGVGARGVNSKGEKYSNYYEFAPSGDRLLLIGITEDKK